MNRVAITGLGCISALGHSVADTWDSLVAGRTGIATITLVPPENLIVRVAAEVKGFDPARHFDEKQNPMLDRFSQFAVVAAREAVKDAGLDLKGERARQTGIVMGVGLGGMTTMDEGFHRLYARNTPRSHPFTIPRLMPSAATSQVSMDLGITGPAFSTTSACASSNHALGEAYWMVRSGRVQQALAGGSEACISYGSMRCWEALRVLAPDACRPFSKERRGMVLGEGGGVVVLENWEHAKARGARIYAELAGFGQSADAGDIVQPSDVGAAAALSEALETSGLAPQQVGYINAHGTGTQINDVVETRAIKLALGALAGRVAISSTKSMHGHGLGAAGALEIIATVKAVQEQFVPPTIAFGTPDPECDLDYTPNQGRKLAIEAALSNSFAFGGLNAVVAVKAV
jgi:nodulation protein E